jgi:hypothetical protein
LKIAGRIAFFTFSPGYQPPPAKVATHPQEHIEDTESGGDADQEIAGHDGLGVIADKSQPSLARIRPTVRVCSPIDVLSDRPWRNLNAELQLQFVRDSPFSPSRVLSGHDSDQLLEVLG